MNKEQSAPPAEGVQPAAQSNEAVALDPSSSLAPQQPPAPQKEKAPTVEESAAAASAMLLDRITRREQPKPEEKPKKSEDKDQQPEENPAPEEAKHRPEEKPKSKLRPKQKEEPDEQAEEQPEKKLKTKPRRTTSEIAAEAAAAAAAETAKRLEEDRFAKEAEVSRRQQQAQIPPDLAPEIEKLQRIQRAHPEAYRGRDLAAELVEATKRESEYERKWRKENPGVAFDWEDAEHAGFLEDNAVNVEQNHLSELEEADRTARLAEQAKRKLEEEYGQELQEVRRSRIERELAPVYQQVNEAYSRQILDAIRPDLIDKLGKGTEVVDALKEDPIAAEAIASVERWAIPGLQAAIAVTKRPDAFRQNSPEVRTLVESALHAESVIASMPEGDRPTTEDGRSFATLKELKAMTPQQRRGYYTIADEDLVPELIIAAARQEASFVKSRAEKLAESYAKRMGFQKKASETTQTQAPKPAPPAAPTVRASIQSDAPKSEAQQSPDGVPQQFWRNLGISK